MEMETGTDNTIEMNPIGFWRRLGASLLDGLIIGVPLGLLGYLISPEAENTWYLDILSGLYTLLLPVFWYGYTIGKKLLGIRIVKLDGEQVGIGTMLLRVLVGMYLLTILTLGIGVIVSAIMVAFRDDKRALHDLVAGTYVTSNKP
jgi:uncharacterized RDD family membrane protein YckC